MKIAVLGGGGFRVPMVYGALLGARRAARRRRGRALRRRRGAARRGSRRCSKASRGSAARSCRSARRPTSRRRVEGADFVFCAIRVGQLEGRVDRRARPARRGRRRPGDDRARRDLLRAADRAGDGAASPSVVARRAPRRVVRQLHEPGGARHRGDPGGARRPRDRDLRLADGALPARRRRARAQARTSCGSTTSGSTTWAGCAASTTATATCCPGCSPTTSALLLLRGGRAVRRRVAALARDDPQRVPLLLLLRLRHGRRAALRAAVARRVPAPPAARRSTAANGDTPEAALDAWRATRRERDETYFAEARAAAGLGEPEERREDIGGYEGEAMAVVEAIAHQPGARAHPRRGEPEQPAVPRRVAPSSRCRASSAAPARCRPRSAPCRATPAR